MERERGRERERKRERGREGGRENIIVSEVGCPILVQLTMTVSSGEWVWESHG